MVLAPEPARVRVPVWELVLERGLVLESELVQVLVLALELELALRS